MHFDQDAVFHHRDIALREIQHARHHVDLFGRECVRIIHGGLLSVSRRPSLQRVLQSRGTEVEVEFHTPNAPDLLVAGIVEAVELGSGWNVSIDSEWNDCD